MVPKDLEKYKTVQSIARETMEFLKSFIKEGVSAKEIKNAAEQFMKQKGILSFWYYNIGAFVFTGEETTISISGKQYEPGNTKVQLNDLVTVDLSPEIDGYWGDFARSFIIQNGKVINVTESKSKEMIEGIEFEAKLHEIFQTLITEVMSFEELFTKMNTFIDKSGFENLDFNKNLGHSIEKNKDHRKYIEAGNTAIFKNVELFTFEPHIRKKDGRYGFKHENIYYFDDGKIQTL